LRAEAEKNLLDQICLELDARIPKSMSASGLRLLKGHRRGRDDFYYWAVETGAEDLFFAGRSVLHRIDYDLQFRRVGSAEDAIMRRLSDGCSITILFLDPRIDILRRLADEEEEDVHSLLENIARSLGTCFRLAESLKQGDLKNNTKGKLLVGVYDHSPYFSYHKDGDRVIVGFYFLTMRGGDSEAYEVEGEDAKKRFESHFTHILLDKKRLATLMEVDGIQGRQTINHGLFTELRTYLDGQLGAGRVGELMKGAQPIQNSNVKPSMRSLPSPRPKLPGGKN